MATISFEIPDEHVPRVTEAFCATFGWMEEDGDKGAFAMAKLMDFIRRTTMDYEMRMAQIQAMQSLQVPTAIDVTQPPA